jgi:pimeloyl-ACP methyl ester carboxylesterase
MRDVSASLEHELNEPISLGDRGKSGADRRTTPSPSASRETLPAVSEERVRDLVLRRERPASVTCPVPMLFVHGLWAGAWSLQNWVERAASTGWDAWAIELRGRNGSRPSAELGRVGIRDFAEDVRDVLMEIGPAVLVGYSLGGLVAQVVTSTDEGERVRALVLACSSAPRGIVGLSGPVVRRMPRYLPALIGSRAFLPRRADVDAMISNRTAPELRADRYARMIEDSGRAAREIAFGTIRVEGAAVRCPALVISAADDHLSPPPVQPKLVRKYHAEHVAFPNHAHSLALEEGWESAADALLGWAERVTS